MRHLKTTHGWRGSLSILAFSSLVWTATPATADPPPGYYDSATGLSGTALRNAVHAIIDDHTRFPYTSGSTDTWDIVSAADEDPLDMTRVVSVYKNESFDENNHTAGVGWNREHSWPNSYGFSQDGGCNSAYTDCHQLFAAFWNYNSARGNRVYDECVAACTDYPVDGSPEVNRGSGAGNTGAWEVWIERRGDVARAMFYMAVRYEGGTHGNTGCVEPDLILTNDRNLIQSNSSSNFSPAYMGILDTLLDWNAEDPVDDWERDRNDAVFGFQGNRNPFIDHPEWVCEIWSCSGGDMIPPVEPMSLLTMGGDCSLTLDWDDNVEPDLLGYNVYRDEGEGYVKLNAGLVGPSTYVDSSAENLAQYFYYVTAVDISNNESGPSAEVLGEPTGMIPCPGSAGQPWINEFHYDNSGTDANEGIEIAGPSGLNLSGWSLVGYNGNGGAQYSTIPLSGVLPDQQNGFGTSFFPVLGLQNGGPDGMALVDNQQNVVQFLSYEGTMAAVGGPASGMTSVDVGVVETGTTPIGVSLQLMGSGSKYDDFTWAANVSSTYDLINVNQTFLPDFGDACRAGNVGEDAGRSPERVLTVNGSSGLGPKRVASISRLDVIDVFLDAGIGGPVAPNYAIWGWNEAPGSAAPVELPFGLGPMCLNPLSSTCNPCPAYSAKTIPGRCNAVLCATAEATGNQAPAIIMTFPSGLFLAGERLWLQGVTRDNSDTSGRRVSITNGVEVLIQN